MKVEKERKDVTLQTDKNNSRRSLLRKTIIGVPVVLTLANKPAFGAVCSLSGFQSVNPSGVGRHGGGCGGVSPGGWKQNGYKTGNQDGNRNMWIDAGFFPNPRISSSLSYNTNHGIHTGDPAGTLFFASIAFQGINPSVSVSGSDTLHDVLLKNPGSLEFHVISNFLNANYFGWGNNDGKMAAEEIRGIYKAYTRMDPTYTTMSGTTINLDTFNLQDFLEQLYH